jgi:uncharacterized membrane protein YfcA
VQSHPLLAYIVVGAVALVAAGLTFFSGFGLGTLLLPAFLPFFAPELAVAATAVVHLANSLFKAALVGRQAHWGVLARFGPTSAAGSLVGAWLLIWLTRVSATSDLASYTLGPLEAHVTPIRLVVAVLMAAFAIMELVPRLEKWSVDPKWLPLGGLLSGFFGGLSGHQGALRSAFLLRAGLTKDQFIATRVLCAIIVDVTRLIVYTTEFARLGELREHAGLIGAAILAAFTGSFLGLRLVKTVTLRAVRLVVGAALLLMSLALAAGVL